VAGYNARMYVKLARWARPTALVALGFVAGLVLAAWIAMPRVAGLRPADGASGAPGTSPIRLTFSRPMDRKTVETALSLSPSTPGAMRWDGQTLTFAPDRPWPSETLVDVSLVGSVRSANGLPLRGPRAWSFTTGVPRLLYLWPSDGPADLYVTSDGQDEAVRLTETTNGVIDFSLGDSGTQIVYAATTDQGSADFHLLDLTTGHGRRLYACPVDSQCGSPSLSDDGQWMAFEQAEQRPGPGEGGIAGAPRIYVTAVEGGTPLAVSEEGHLAANPVWASDGKLAYYDGALRATVVLSQPAAGQPSMIAAIPNDLGLTGAWSPAADYLVFPEIVFLDEHAAEDGAEAGGVEGFFYSHLLRADLPSIKLSDISAVSGQLVEDTSAAISPDDVWLAFARKELTRENWTLGRQLWLARTDGSQARRLLEEPNHNHSAIQWSADGAHLAYMRLDQESPGEPPEIWVFDLELETAERLVQGGFRPIWIP
jgi:Tol biopolymer transport system component